MDYVKEEQKTRSFLTNSPKRGRVKEEKKTYSQKYPQEYPKEGHNDTKQEILHKGNFLTNFEGNKIKEAFNKVKQDMDFLKNELNNLRNELKENQDLMVRICENVYDMSNQINQTRGQINPVSMENFPADNSFSKSLNKGNSEFSIGNGGVPADRQTDQQTDRQSRNNIEDNFPADRQIENSIENAAEMIKSLGDLKKEIYKKFKKLTEQEWLVFLTIYQFDEEIGYSDYKILAEKLKLTESSIRDYVARLINKGIPIDKTKLNNKNIRLNIAQSIKQIASLSTIITLREI